MILASCILFADQSVSLKLEYSILYQNSKNSTILSIDSGDVVFDGDKLKLNVQYPSNAYCYLIYEDPNQNVMTLFSSSTNVDNLKISNFHTTGWLSLSPPSGKESIFFLLSEAPLSVIEKVVSDLGNARGGRAKKLYRRYESEIDNLLSPKKNQNALASRLDKPVVGGVSFRGDDDKLNGYSLTHKAEGKGVVIKKIVLNHQ